MNDTGTTSDDEIQPRRIHPLNHGRVYLVFGQGAHNVGGTPVTMPRYEGAFDLAGGPKFDDAALQISPAPPVQLNADDNGDGYPDLQGIVFKGDGLHSLMGKEVSPLPAVGGKSFNGDAIDDFMIGFASYDTDLEDTFGFTRVGGWTPGCNDPEFRESGFGATAIVYGGALATAPSAGNNWNLNPWTMSEYSLPSTLDLRDKFGSRIAQHPTGIYMVGGSQFGYLGYCGPAGDFNGDTYPDALIGHSRYRNTLGQAYVLLSKGGVSGQEQFPDSPHANVPSAFFAQHDDPTITFTHSSGSNPYTGLDYWIRLTASYATTEDYETQVLDADGAQPWDAGSLEARVYTDPAPGGLIGSESGLRPISSQYDDSNALGVGEFVGLGLDFGWSVWSAGDVNGDQKDDILIGAPCESRGLLNDDATLPWMPRGRAYLVQGFAPSSSADYTLDLDAEAVSSSPTTQVAIFRGEHNGDQAGYAVSAAGDVDGDGWDDFLISAPWADHPDTAHNHNQNTPTCWGGVSGDDVPGHHVMDDTIDDSGDAVNPDYVDVNGNGSFDLGTDFRGPVGDGQVSGKGFHRDLGAVYLVYGRAGGFSGDISLAKIDDPAAHPSDPTIIRGLSLWGMTGRGVDALDGGVAIAQSDYDFFDAPEFGYSLAGNEDLDGDGTPDFLIGVPAMSKPLGSNNKYFPMIKPGGVVAMFGETCGGGGQLVADDMRTLIEEAASGQIEDRNNDGIGDALDLLEAVGALGGSE